jgi:hypothetical protein
MASRCAWVVPEIDAAPVAYAIDFADEHRALLVNVKREDQPRSFAVSRK